MSEFTPQQIQDWRAYEKVRAGGRYNMFDPRARASAGLERVEFLFVLNNYEALKKAAGEKK